MTTRGVLLMRHGAVDRKPGALLGALDPPLNALGKAQAMAWRSVFKHHPPAAVFHSPLLRAAQTARLAVTDEQVPFIVSTDLREICLGEWEDLGKEDIERRYPGAWAKRGKNFAAFRPNGGESFADLSKRAIPVLWNMSAMASTSGKAVLAVTHAGVIRTLLCCILELNLNNLFRIEINCGNIAVVDVQLERPRILSVNLPPSAN